MKIFIKNRQEARLDSYRDTDKNIAIISIYTPGDSPNVFAKRDNIKDILFLSFHDLGCRDSTGIPMSNKDAEKVASFVFKNRPNIDELWVHCDGGVSRSAGVAAAIAKYFIGDDSPIFDSPFYRPNMDCYRKTLNALHNTKGTQL